MQEVQAARPLRQHLHGRVMLAAHPARGAGDGRAGAPRHRQELSEAAPLEARIGRHDEPVRRHRGGCARMRATTSGAPPGGPVLTPAPRDPARRPAPSCRAGCTGSPAAPHGTDASAMPTRRRPVPRGPPSSSATAPPASSSPARSATTTPRATRRRAACARRATRFRPCASLRLQGGREHHRHPGVPRAHGPIAPRARGGGARRVRADRRIPDHACRHPCRCRAPLPPGSAATWPPRSGRRSRRRAREFTASRVPFARARTTADRAAAPMGGHPWLRDRGRPHYP